jgi:hypothetical protein
MLVQEVISLDEKQIWGRKGTKLVRKYRCMSGQRKGRIVPTPTACFAAPDIKKRQKMKITRARLGAKMARKSKRTKRTNPASIRLRTLNRR